MMNRLQKIRDSAWYERIYKVGVSIKGFDGVVELAAGLWLWAAPVSLHNLLIGIMNEMNEHHGKFSTFVAEYIAHVDTDLMKGSIVFVIVFLISHGVIKLALVYALLKEILWAYPYALVILVLFLIVQVYAFITKPSFGMFFFALLDVVIIWLVWGEWQRFSQLIRNNRST